MGYTHRFSGSNYVFFQMKPKTVEGRENIYGQNKESESFWKAVKGYEILIGFQKTNSIRVSRVNCCSLDGCFDIQDREELKTGISHYPRQSRRKIEFSHTCVTRFQSRFQRDRIEYDVSSYQGSPST